MPQAYSMSGNPRKLPAGAMELLQRRVVEGGENTVSNQRVGADFTRGRGTAGLVVAHSLGEGGFRSPSDGGEIESTLTGLYPWGATRRASACRCGALSATAKSR